MMKTAFRRTAVRGLATGSGERTAQSIKQDGLGEDMPRRSRVG